MHKSTVYTRKVKKFGLTKKKKNSKRKRASGKRKTRFPNALLVSIWIAMKIFYVCVLHFQMWDHGYSARREKCFQLCWAFFNGSRALFTGPTSTFFSKKNFKLGPIILFTYLKIILLQCFQFSEISDIKINS